MAFKQVQPAEWNKQSRVEARRLLTALRQAQPTTGERVLPGAGLIQGHPLKKGITDALFGELVVGCLLHYKSARAELDRRESDFRGSPYLDWKSIRTTYRRAAALPDPEIARLAEHRLNLNSHLRQLGQPYIKRLQDRLRFLDPVVCLYVLFKYLVRLNRKQSIEWYERHYFPEILEVAGIRTPTGRRWTFANIQRRLRPDRKGGEALARQVAGLLLSTRPMLKRYRPTPSFKNGVSPLFGEWDLSIRGQHLYSVENIPPLPPWLREPEHAQPSLTGKPRHTSTP